MTLYFNVAFWCNRIDGNWVIKVADFGLSEMMNSSKDYFRQNQNVEVKLPIKWMAPECLREGIYSEKSDVVCLLYLYVLYAYTYMYHNRIHLKIAHMHM